MGFICTSHEGAFGMSDIYSVASYRYFGGTFRMAHLASGWFCFNADDFIECSCPDYSNCPKCTKENCPPPNRNVFVYHIWAGI